VPPQVRIFYNIKDREIGAQEESAAFRSLFDELGYPVEVFPDFTTEQVFNEIRQAQAIKPLSCLIIGMMGHGQQGLILDTDEKPIEITELITHISSGDLDGIPKILIMQCCQGFPEGNTASVPCRDFPSLSDPARPVRPTEHPPPIVVRPPDFTLIMATVSGETVERNKFIPLLANYLGQSSADEDIHASFLDASYGLGSSQTPHYQTTNRKRLNPKRTYR